MLGKSVLCSQIVYYLRTFHNIRCLMFFCDFHTTGYQITLQILRSLCAQIITLAPAASSFMYDECVATGKPSSVAFLKTLVPRLLTSFDDIRILIDGLDEVDQSGHGELVKTMIKMVDNHDTCKLLISSQDIPSIRIRLKATPSIFLGSQAEHVAKDIKLIVERRLEDIKDTFGLQNSQDLFDQLEKTILNRAEGMSIASSPGSNGRSSRTQECFFGFMWSWRY